MSFRVWAPARRSVSVVLEGFGEEALPGGYFSGHVPAARAGSKEKFRFDGDERLYPDPATRHQPQGPHGWSEVVDPCSYRWSDHEWKGAALEGQPRQGAGDDCAAAGTGHADAFPGPGVLGLADHKPAFAGLVANGRREFLVARFGTWLDRTEITRNARVVALHRDLLRLRR